MCWTGRGAFCGNPPKTTKSCLRSCGGESGIGGVDRERRTAGGGQRRRRRCIQRPRHQLCLAHWFRHLEAFDAALSVVPTAQVPPGSSGGSGMRRTKCKRASGPGRFCARWRCAARRWSRSFRRNGIRCWAFSLSSTVATPLAHHQSGRGWFKHLRRYLSRFPGCRNAEHSEQVLG